MLNLFLTAMLAMPAPVSPVVHAWPLGSASGILYLHADGSQSIGTLEDALAGRPHLSTLFVTGPPTILRLTYEATEGQMVVETDCRSYNSITECVKSHARSVRVMQEQFPRVTR